MTNITFNAKYGLFLLIPLVISLLFVGMSNITNASEDGPELNQSDVGFVSPAQIWLWLRIDGTDIEGDSTLASMDRADKIEVWSLRYEVSNAREGGSSRFSGARSYSPIVITKPVDRSSPLIFKGLTENQVVEAEFRFYRPSPIGDGSTEHYYTIIIEQGRITSIKFFTFTDFNSGATYNMEEVSFVYQRITVTYMDGGIEHVDDLRGGA